VRALVTGADGFAGRHLVRHLTSRGDDVLGVDRECDVADLEAVTEVLDGYHPDAIYHLAAMTHVGESWSSADLVTRVNVLGTANVLAAARQVVPLATVLVVSSADVYGVVAPTDLPLREVRRPVPVSPYAISKVEAERIALDAARTMHQRVVIARPFNHVGPGQATTFAVPALANRLLDALGDDREAIAVGDLSTRRDFSDVRDVVRAYRLLVQFGSPGEVYNIASGLDVTLEEIARTLVEMIRPGTRLEVDAALLRPVEVPVMRGSAQKLHDATGWEPNIALATSLADVVADLRAERAAS
jgi:GDP-4-dehydro-6-deoxy-D-mannose reductase